MAISRKGELFLRYQAGREAPLSYETKLDMWFGSSSLSRRLSNESVRPAASGSPSPKIRQKTRSTN